MKRGGTPSKNGRGTSTDGRTPGPHRDRGPEAVWRFVFEPRLLSTSLCLWT